MIALFDFINLLFSKKDKEWKELTDSDKNRNFFMMNRFLSIQYPQRVLVLSLLKVDAPSAANYWKFFLSQHFSRTPGWIYTKTSKKDKEKKEYYPSDEMIKWYCRNEQISIRDFKEKVTFLKTPFLEEIKELEKVLISQGIIKK